MNKLPITPGVPYHSIIGDRGRGDTPNSSDGVDPYWSSLEGAQSELIVDSDLGTLWDARAERDRKAIDYAKFFSRSHDCVIRVYDDAGNVTETREHARHFKKW